MSKKWDRRGVLLVTVMFFILVVGMLARAILIVGPGMARIGGQAQDELLAQRAAEAGATYARTQLRGNVDWKGDLNATTVDLPDLKVVEDNGNVIGWVKNGAGQVAQFRIRFNYQDGPSGPDSLDDPAGTHEIDTIYVSMNNLRGGDGTLPRADVGSWKVTDPTVGPDLPAHTAVIEVEGLAGRALSQTTGPDSARGPGSLLRRVLKVVYHADVDIGIPEAVISAGNGIKIEMTKGAEVDKVGTEALKLRSKKGVDVTKPDGSDNILTMADGEIYRNAADGVHAAVSGSVDEKDEDPDSAFFELSWDEVPKASADPGEAVQIQGGVYVVQPTGTYKYYDMSLSDYKALTPDAATGIRPGGVDLSDNWKEVRPSSNLGIGGLNVDKSKYMLELTKDVNVNTSPGGVDDIVITTIQGRRLHEEDTTGDFMFTADDATFFLPGTLHMSNSNLTSKGDVDVLINVNGENGSIVAEGNAVVAAPSVAIKKLGAVLFEQRLSLYVQGDLTVSTFISQPEINAWPYFVSPAYTGYGPLDLQGLIYTWGDTNILAGTPGRAAGPGFGGYTPTNYGEISIQGALVSYGADLEVDPTAKPGSGGNGAVNMYGEFASIKYDSSKLASDPTSVPAGAPLDAITRLSYGFEGN
ncbi:MAG: hypothetical protein KC910_01480 [Candidatus Eremiobacteraeota bacterium]|nr:hypothetical protein [Candidatus Eremiobacteraeota bacterium]